MEIEDFIPDYPSIADAEFDQEIFAKTEFRPDRVAGTALPHQQRVARYMSPATLYDRLLVFHEMGTGKTCTAVSTVETTIAQNTSISKALIVVKGPSHIDNFITELVTVCAPEKYGHLRGDARVRSKLKPNYEFTTHEVFAKQLGTRPSGYYNNTVIVIDEVHNINTRDRESYGVIHAFLHTVKNCKVLLMSGTPMRDNAEDIAEVMNLILPMDRQLPVGNAFHNLFAGKKLTPLGATTLQQAFQGRVSYLRSNISNVAKKYMGVHLGTLSEFYVFPTTMSRLQTRIYAPLLENEDDLFLSARQSSLFVFPDGSYGSSGFAKYIARNERASSSGEMKNNYTARSPVFTTYVSDIANLATCSSKYAFILRSLIDNRHRLTFIYCEFVEGSGLVLFSKILEAHGYARASGKESGKGLRYGIITNMTTTVKQTRRVLDRFNDKSNITGNYIHVILGSRMISEGFTLKNVQETHILTPHWNYSETDQAVARTFRSFSHDALIASGVDPVLRIYHHVAIPDDGRPSIDLRMYEISEGKDLKIKQVERVVKTSAFDCSMTKSQNTITGHDGQRVCEYGPCAYTCHAGDVSAIVSDRNTYDMYYADAEAENVASDIRQQLAADSPVRVDAYQPRVVSRALKLLHSVTNKYGVTGYVKTDDGTVYASKTVYDNSDSGNMFYFSNPIFAKKVPFSRISTDLLYTHRIPLLMDDLVETLDPAIISELPLQVQEDLLETSVIAPASALKQCVTTFFAKYIHTVRDTTVSSYPYATTRNMRCLGKRGWYDCPQSMVDDILSQKQDVVARARDFGYYGVSDKTKFLVKIVPGEQAADKRLAPRGRVCATIDKSELVNIMSKAGIPYDTPKSKKDECRKLHDWFVENNLMVYM